MFEDEEYVDEPSTDILGNLIDGDMDIDDIVGDLMVDKDDDILEEHDNTTQ